MERENHKELFEPGKSSKIDIKFRDNQRLHC
jgi:hypothetical protein